MSERNVKLFYNEMCKNEKLQNEIKEVLGGANTESDKQAILNNIAKKYRFDFTPEEAKKFAENLSKNKLSLDDLSDVSGGIGIRTAAIAFTALTALGSLGSAGAIVSHAEWEGLGNYQFPESSTQKVRNIVEDLNLNEEEKIKIYEKLTKESKYAQALENINNMIKSKENPKIFSQAKCSDNGETTQKIKENLKTLFSNALSFMTSVSTIANLVKENTSGNWKKTTYNGGSAYLYYNPKLDLKLDLTYSYSTDKYTGERNLLLVTNSSIFKHPTQKIVCTQNLYDESTETSKTVNEKLGGKLGLEQQLNMVRAICNALENIKRDKSFPKEIKGINVLNAMNELIQTIMPDASKEEDFNEYYYDFEKETDEKLDKICVEPGKKKMDTETLFNNATSESANDTSSEVQNLAENLKTSYKDNKEKTTETIRNLFQDSDYNIWYHYKGWAGSYYLLKNDKKQDDHYYLSQRYNGHSNKVIYYKDSKNTEDLNNSNLEKQLHQRRLFRNALKAIEAEAKSNGNEEMKQWATELKNEIMPDKPDYIKDTDFYRP